MQARAYDLASLAPLPESRRDGESVRLRLVNPELGMTPENSVVNGADTSTDRSIKYAALSAKDCVAPLLVKTRDVTMEMLKFLDELTIQMRCM